MPQDATDVRQQLATALTGRSVHAVAKVLGIGREQVSRLAAGLPVRKGTMLVAREALARLTSAA